MDIENRFLETKSFLRKHFELFSNEVLENFKNITLPYSSWAEEIAQMKQQQRVQLENLQFEQLTLSSSFQDFLQQNLKLRNIDKLQISHSKIAQNLIRKLSLKKQHEIIQIRKLIGSEKDRKYLDIGSGAGHLSSVLLDKNSSTSICIDREEEYQKIGKKKLEREAKSVKERITFLTDHIDQQTSFEHFDFNTLIGLHTCGNLAVDLIKVFAPLHHKSFLNFGCCYHKLTSEQINISSVAKSDSLIISYQALTMAAKSHKKLTLKELQSRESVKNFRYTLHLFMSEVMQQGFTPLGNARRSDYQISFAEYAKKYLPELANLKSKELNLYYESKKEKVRFIQSLGTIRSTLARLVELYLILDRALYLTEHGHEVSVKEVFDSNVSPRNLCLWIP